MTKPLPAIKLVGCMPSGSMKWRVTFPDGREYAVTSYPDSKIVLILKWPNGRMVNGPKMTAAIREAIDTELLRRPAQ